MKITQDGRDYAAQSGTDESGALDLGWAEKAAQVREEGADIYRDA